MLRLALLCLWAKTWDGVLALSSSSKPRAKRTTPFSNRIRLDETLMDGSSKKFPRTWVPLAAIDHLDPDRPTPLEFMGAKYVCYQDNAGEWVVMDDRCPHRLAPLSEGRIEREKNTIECAYHGWQFDSSGKCQRIPQLEDELFQKAVESPLSCVASYPIIVEKGLLWSWLWSDDPLSVAGVPEAHPEVICKGVNGPKYMRDLPYGWDTLMENLLDPAHVPFAHHGLQGTRDDAIPINMTVPSDVTPYGFRMEFEDRTMKNLRKGFGELRAPYMLHYEGYYYDEDGNRKEDKTPFRLSTVCIPIRPGWSRIIIVPGGFGGDDEGKDKDGKKPSLVSKIFKAIPPWIVHVLNSRFLDSDLAFLHYQEREARARAPDRVADAYFMPAPADRCIAATRTWIRTYARAWESQPLPESPTNRDELFDRYGQHVSICRHCQKALEGLKTWKRNSYVVLAVSIVVLNLTPVATVTAAGSLLMLPLLNAVERSVTQGGYDHYKT
eukprot:scaffold190_cov171-Amphora_coffeaeformis.AAC.12